MSALDRPCCWPGLSCRQCLLATSPRWHVSHISPLCNCLDLGLAEMSVHYVTYSFFDGGSFQQLQAQSDIPHQHLSIRGGKEEG